MKKIYSILTFIIIVSCASNEEEIAISEPTEFTFKYNLHSSLPADWITEFYVIMKNLDDLIPIKHTNYFYELPIYALV